MERHINDESGFTLVELLVVIVILGILSAIAVVSSAGITDKGKASACKTDVRTVVAASEAYYAPTLSYAASMAALVTAGFLRKVPSTSNGYTISYTTADGSVSSTPACSTL